MQPLNGSLKTAVRKECDFFEKSHALQQINPYYVASIFDKAFCNSITIQKNVLESESILAFLKRNISWLLTIYFDSFSSKNGFGKQAKERDEKTEKRLTRKVAIKRQILLNEEKLPKTITSLRIVSDFSCLDEEAPKRKEIYSKSSASQIKKV